MWPVSLCTSCSAAITAKRSSTTNRIIGPTSDGDEIREVSPGVYLGVVYWGKEKEHAHKLIHFALKF